jgi:N-acetyl-anhydromuramyl-L-alanine amidase AmpD
MEIDKISYKISENNYYNIVTEKKRIVLCDSLRKDHNHIKRLQKKEYGKSKTWPTYTIDREGNVFEHFDPKYYSDYYGDTNIDMSSIYICIENMGVLTYDIEKRTYSNWINEICNVNDVSIIKWKGYSFWEKYRKDQIISVFNLCSFLCEKFKIDNLSIGYNNYDENALNFNGIICISNFDNMSCSVNPTFKYENFKKKNEINN